MNSQDYGYQNPPETGGFVVWVLGDKLAFVFETLDDAIEFQLWLMECTGQIPALTEYLVGDNVAATVAEINKDFMPMVGGNPKPTFH